MKRIAFGLVPAIGISFLFLSPAMAGPPKPKIDSFSCNPDGTVRLKTTGKDADQNLVRIEGQIDRYPDVNHCQTFSGLENSITVIDETFAATGSKTITQADDTVCMVGKGYRAVVKDTDAASNTGMTLTQKCCACESLPPIGPFGGDDTGFIPRGAGSDNQLFAKCQDKVANNFHHAVDCIIKCHRDRAKLRLLDDNAEDDCEEGDPAKSCFAKFRLGEEKSGVCPRCLLDTQQDVVFFESETIADDMNGLIYCASASGAFIDGAPVF